MCDSIHRWFYSLSLHPCPFSAYDYVFGDLSVTYAVLCFLPLQFIGFSGTAPIIYVSTFIFCSGEGRCNVPVSLKNPFSRVSRELKTMCVFGDPVEHDIFWLSLVPITTALQRKAVSHIPPRLHHTRGLSQPPAPLN